MVEVYTYDGGQGVNQKAASTLMTRNCVSRIRRVVYGDGAVRDCKASRRFVMTALVTRPWLC